MCFGFLEASCFPYRSYMKAEPETKRERSAENTSTFLRGAMNLDSKNGKIQ